MMSGSQVKWIAESADDRPVTLAIRSGRRVRPMLWSALALGTAAVAGTAAWLLKTPPADRLIAARFQHSLPESQNFTGTTRHVVAISPDGTNLVYTANRQLYLRGLNQLEGQPIRGTADTAPAIEPVFSPDRAVDCVLRGRVALAGRARQLYAVKRVAVAGGTPVTLAQIAPPFGASWQGGMIAVGQGEGGIQAIPDSGGSPRTIVTVDSKLERAVQPELLDDGRHILFAVPSPLNTGRETASGEGAIVVQESAAAPGKSSFPWARTLASSPLANCCLSTTGSSWPLGSTPSVSRSPAHQHRLSKISRGAAPSAAGQFAVSRTGTLVVRTGRIRGRDATTGLGRSPGRRAVNRGVPGNYQQPRMSPDGKRLAVSKAANIWIWSFTTDTLMRLTNEPAVQVQPGVDTRRPPHCLRFERWGWGGDRSRAADGTGPAETVAPAPAGNRSS